MTRKEYWQELASDHIYMLGIGFAREYYNYKVLPKLSIKRLKEYCLKSNELNLEQEFENRLNKFGEKDCPWHKIRDIQSKYNKKKLKLAKELEK